MACLILPCAALLTFISFTNRVGRHPPIFRWWLAMPNDFYLGRKTIGEILTKQVVFSSRGG